MKCTYYTKDNKTILQEISFIIMLHLIITSSNRKLTTRQTAAFSRSCTADRIKPSVPRVGSPIS